MRFYCPELNRENQTILLTKEESAHCIRVLRLREGSLIEAVNGAGLIAKGQILNADPKSCLIQLLSFQFYEPPTPVHIGMALTKQMDRMEWFIEKAVEYGITKLTLLDCENSERRSIRIDRLEKTAISAMKQSQRAYLPEIEFLVPFHDFIEKNPNAYIAHCYEGEKKNIKEILDSRPIIIGPEGDFSRLEVEKAMGIGLIPISFGEYRLRTESAALCAVAKLALF